MTKQRRTPILVACVAGCVAAGPAGGQQVDAPRWEAGLGIGAVAFPVYRGAAETSAWVFPVPYFIYRGDVLRSERSGVGAVFVDESRLKFDLSANASPPVRSTAAPIRDGMGALRPTVELGPSIAWRMWRSSDTLSRIEVALPVRAAVTVEASPRYIGTLGGAYLDYDRADAFGIPGLSIGARIGADFQSGRYNRYFYDVTSREARPDRPAYMSAGGYAGSTAILSVSRRYPRYWIGAFLRFDSLSGATFDQSPLVETNRYTAGGLAITWFLGRSKENVRVDVFRQ